MTIGDLVSLALVEGGLVCLLAACFTFVWWSSRTFFITAGAFVPLSAALAYILHINHGWFLPGAALAGMSICVLIGLGLAATFFERSSRLMLSERHGGTARSFSKVVLSAAIVSFAFYLIIINGTQWLLSGEVDSLSLRPAAVDPVTTLSFWGIPLPLRTNRLGLWKLALCWSAGLLLLGLLASRLGLNLRAMKTNLALFRQVTGRDRLVRLLAFGLCSLAAGLVGIAQLLTSRADVSGGLTITLEGMVVMVLGTQTRRLWVVPLFSILLAGVSAFLQGLGLSLWVEPMTLGILMCVLVMSPQGLLSEVRRFDEAWET